MEEREREKKRQGEREWGGEKKRQTDRWGEERQRLRQAEKKYFR